MADYVDGLTLRIEGYEGGHPSAETLADGTALHWVVGGEVDRGRLTAEVRAVLERDLRLYHLGERYGHMSWGATGAGLDLVVQVGIGVLSSGVATVIIEAVRRAARRSPSRSEYVSEGAVGRIREVLSEALGCAPDEVTVERLDRAASGWSATARRGRLAFEVEIPPDGRVTFRRGASRR